MSLTNQSLNEQRQTSRGKMTYNLIANVSEIKKRVRPRGAILPDFVVGGLMAC